MTDDPAPQLPPGTADTVARQMLRDDRDMGEWTGTGVLDLMLRLEDLDPPEAQAERRAVLERETSLSAGQLDTYAGLRAQGLSNRQVAERMRVHRRTAEKYAKRLAAFGSYEPGGVA